MDPFAAPSTAGGSSGPSSLTISSDSVFNAPVGRLCPATGRASGRDGTQQQSQTSGQDRHLEKLKRGCSYPGVVVGGLMGVGGINGSSVLVPRYHSPPASARP